MNIIDLRSDTFTLPNGEMQRAMYEAELGDDVYGEDPTVNRLEELAAGKLGKEAALLTASGTMSNLIAILTHTRPGNEIILGSEAHIFWYEVGGASALAGVVMRTVSNDEQGQMDPEAVEKAIRLENIHSPKTALVCLENTHNRCGGAVLTPEYTTEISIISHERNCMVHIDGARIFNAAVALNLPASELSKDVDSACFCLSKSLSAPVGSVLAGTKEFIERARKWRKMLGGGMRQAGVIAAAGIVSLETMIDRLAIDHANAKRLAEGLANIHGISIDPESVQTNIVIFTIPGSLSVLKFIESAALHGVKLGRSGENRIRAVTHRMIDSPDIDNTLGILNNTLKDISDLK